jgi:isoleucyl-tRNA synthetase
MLRELVKLLAPILPFTAEDAWRNLPDCLTEGVESVHLTVFEEVETTGDEERELEAWQPYLEVRSLAQKRLEEARESGLIRDSLQARLEITVPADMVESARGEDWADLLIVSSAEVTAGGETSVRVLRADGDKCQRCWKWTPEVGEAPYADDVCLRCSSVLASLEGD